MKMTLPFRATEPKHSQTDKPGQSTASMTKDIIDINTDNSTAINGTNNPVVTGDNNGANVTKKRSGSPFLPQASKGTARTLTGAYGNCLYYQDLCRFYQEDLPILPRPL